MPPPALLTARGGMRGPLPWTTGITAIYAAKGVIFTRRSGGQYSTPIDTRMVEGAHNAELGKILDQANLPADNGAPHLAVAHFDLGNVLGSLNGSWRYNGSLTAPASFAPTCEEPEGTVAHQLEADDLPENVSWVVLSHTIPVSSAQISAFKKLFHEGNSRETMPLKGRKVTRYK